MKQFWRLLLIQTRERFGFSLMTSGGISKKEKNKQIGSVVGVAIAVLYLLALLGFVMYMLFDSTIKLGMGELILTVVFMAAMMMTMLLGMFVVMSVLFMSKDNELLCTLPINQGAVFASKFAQVYLSELGVCGMFIVPAIVLYGVISGQGAMFYAMSVPVLLLTPILPLIIASILGMLLMLLVGRSRHRDAFIMAGSMIMMLGLMAGQMVLTSSISSADDVALLISGQMDMLTFISSAFPPAGWAVHAITDGLGGLGWFAVLAAVCAAGLAVAILIASRFYGKMALSFLETRRSGKKIDVAKSAGHTGSAGKALFMKEWKTVMRSPTYAMNSLIGVVLSPLMVVFMAYQFSSNLEPGKNMADMIGEMAGETGAVMITLILAAVMAFFTTMSSTLAATAISREGRTMWIVKTIPVSIKKQVMSKLWMSISVSFLSTILTIAAIYIFVPLPLTLVIPAFLITMLFAVGESALGIAIDTRKPKLNWATEAEAMKQNANAVVCMLVSMGVIVIGGGLAAGISMLNAPGWLAVLCVLAFSALFMLLMFLLLDRAIKKGFN